jgi:ABC-type Fe3+/spermidine/putrescine transport system ATPase subunit
MKIAAFLAALCDQDEALLLSDRIAVMNRGRIEQIGRPDEIYDKPASRFVAEFVGESNFLHGELAAGDEGGAIVQVGALRFHVPRTPDLSLGQVVELALRPEKIVITGRGEPAAEQHHVAEVEDVLYVGQMVKYIVRVAGGAQLTVKQQRGAGATSFSPGDQVRIAWQTSDIRLFRV